MTWILSLLAYLTWVKTTVGIVSRIYILGWLTISLLLLASVFSEFESIQLSGYKNDEPTEKHTREYG